MNQLTSYEDFDSKKDLIKKLFCKGSTDDELQLFIHACKRSGLDPFMKQIYAIKRGPTMTIQTGIDGFRLLADRSGKYSPGRESTYSYDDKGKLISATSYVKKLTQDGTWHDVMATAYLDEYGANQGLWQKMPRTMLAKCAEALALRKAFPAELSGLYTSDEMHQADQHVNTSTGEIICDKEPAFITEAQVNIIEVYFEEYPESKKWLLEKLSIDSVTKVPAASFESILAVFKAKDKKKEE